jgi:hypothetical protein
MVKRISKSVRATGDVASPVMIEKTNRTKADGATYRYVFTLCVVVNVGVLPPQDY